jgi:hypothetical protein
MEINSPQTILAAIFLWVAGLTLSLLEVYLVVGVEK